MQIKHAQTRFKSCELTFNLKVTDMFPLLTYVQPLANRFPNIGMTSRIIKQFEANI